MLICMARPESMHTMAISGRGNLPTSLRSSCLFCLGGDLRFMLVSVMQ